MHIRPPCEIVEYSGLGHPVIKSFTNQTHGFEAMPAEFPPFDVAARIAKDNPRAFFACRHEVIDRVILCADAHESLQLLQDRVDEIRLTEASPMRSLNTLMEILSGHLSTLSELLAHWQSVLEMDLDDTEVQAAIARFPAMLLSIERVRNQIAEAVGNPL